MSLDRYLFRGICKETKKWVYGGIFFIKDRAFIVDGDELYQRCCGGCICNGADDTFYPDHEEVILETIGQWTGCFDREDSQIFEGDLIKNKQGEIGRVYLHGTGFRVSTEISPAGFDALWWMQLHKYNPPSPEDDPTPNCDVSIIGSIHDHLLGEKQ